MARLTARTLVGVLIAFSLAVSGCGTRQTRQQIIGALSTGHDGGVVPTAGDEVTLGTAPGTDPASGPALSAPQEHVGPTAQGSGAAAVSSSPASSKEEANTGGARRVTTAGGTSSGSAAAPSSQATAVANPASQARPAGSDARAGGAGIGPGVPGGKSPVVIGSIGTYSGVVGAVFSSGLPTVGVVTKYINANGGLNGHPVQVITADDQADPTRYLSLVKQMVERDGVLAFMGNMVPLSVKGADAYLQNKGVPVIGGDVTNSFWDQSPILFPQATTYTDLNVAAAQAAVKYGHVKKLGLLYCGEIEGCRITYEVLQNGGAERAGAELVYSAQISLAQPDFTAECLQARQRGVEALWMATDDATVIRVARSCAQQGFTPRYMAINLTVTNRLEGHPELGEMIAGEQIFPWMASDTLAARTFQAAMKADAPDVVVGSAAAAVWTSGMLLKAASVNLPAQPVSKDILDGLYNLPEGETLGGLAPPLKFVRGKPAPARKCAFFIQLKDQKWVAPDGSKVTCV